jgi:hypothetical protein
MKRKINLETVAIWENGSSLYLADMSPEYKLAAIKMILDSLTGNKTDEEDLKFYKKIKRMADYRVNELEDYLGL